ncbi:ATP-binding protein [Frankia sp. CiP3]|uniref:ATP-binding protein n=1 Tax=Frankia sp. CiP3 TaxID=2880971 RepID=UPI001EF46CB5|nr:ATP-binding protein [Frankia sp. CiP3]
MPWEPWVIGEYARLARYVAPAAFLGSSFVPQRIFELRGRWSEACRELYDTLAKLELHYDTAPWTEKRYTQLVREPADIVGDRRGTCLEVATMFAALCLAARLRPYLVVVSGGPGSSPHALVLVDGFDPGDGRRAVALPFDHGVAAVGGIQLQELGVAAAIARGAVAAIDCTGFTYVPGRPGGPVLSFDNACRAGREQLDAAHEINLVDVVWCQRAAHEPTPARRVPDPFTQTATDAGRAATACGDAAGPSDAYVQLAEHSRRVAHEAGLPLDTHQPGRVSLPDLYVPRQAVEDELLAACEVPSASIVVGEAGVGKTSLLWHLARQLEEAGRRWLFLRSTDLSTGRLAQPPGGRAVPAGRPAVEMGLLADALRGGRHAQPTVLLVDTIDLLLRSDRSDILASLLLLGRESGAALVLTCREQESLKINALPHSDPHRRVPLEPYTKPETVLAVRRHARHFCTGTGLDPDRVGQQVMNAVARDLPLTEIVRRPLTLRMLFETERDVWAQWVVGGGAPHADIPEINTELDVTDLYERYWELRVRIDARVGIGGYPQLDVSTATHLVAVLMLALGRPVIDRKTAATELARTPSLVPARKAGLDTLTSRGLVFEITGGPSTEIQFFHQTFFEYAVGRALLDLGTPAVDDLVTRARRYPDDLFLAAVAQQTLLLACRSEIDAREIDRIFAALLTDSNPATRQLAVAAYAQARCRGPLTAEAGRRVLAQADDGLVRRFLSYVPRVRHTDIDSVLRDLTVLWGPDGAEVPADTRTGILRALASLGGFVPDLVHAHLHSQRTGWMTWFTALSPAEARRRREGPLALVRALGRADQRWASDHLQAIIEKMGDAGDRHDALASALEVAAETLTDQSRLRPFLALVPSSARVTHGGTTALRRALAGIQHTIWRTQGYPLEAAVAEILGPSQADGPNLGANVHADGDAAAMGKSRKTADRVADGAELIRRHAQWWALAELAHEADGASVRGLLAGLLAIEERQHQFEFANHCLRHLIEGEFRPQVPGASSPRSGPATVAARDACREQLSGGGPADASARQAALLCRAALDHAGIPATGVADIVSTVNDQDPAGSPWLAEDGLACLTVPAALGGHSQAREVLEAWAAPPAPGEPRPRPEDRNVRKIFLYRLRNASRTDPAALEYLVREAARSRRADFLIGALDDRPERAAPLPRPLARRIADLGAALLADQTPEIRGQAYRIYADLLREPTPPDATSALLPGLGERLQQASSAGLTVLQRMLDHHPHLLMPAVVFEPVQQKLSRLAVDGIAPSVEATDRARDYLRTLICRCGPLSPRPALLSTVRQARDLVLEPQDSAALAPFGVLISRVVAVDPGLAADLLVEASRVIHGITGSNDSWKGRRAHRWRGPVIATVPKLGLTDWHRMMKQLAQEDEALLMQAVDVSIQYRVDEVDELTIAILAEAHVSEQVMASYRASRQRKQRRQGGTETWLPVLETWRQRGSAR